MKLKTVVVPAIVLLSLSVSGFLVARVHSARSKQGFTLHIVQSVYPKTGAAPLMIASSVRYQKSDGSWRKETTYQDGRNAVGFAQPGRGVFFVDEKNRTLQRLSGSSEHGMNETELRGDPTFVGEELILGYKTFHLHSVSNSGESTDSYICPALQGYPLKLISDSNGAKTVFEVTQVVLGEPSFTLPDYPVDSVKSEQLQKARTAPAR
jgi:hypothetical protein